ncbi:MAG: protein-L-isoaspartate(D-aspartate) O-methyltransferase [Proteobacteria bacterium]|nr:protein-L-isoaspartate(D-aspartate) O-methyltransferase [Pseudomonadota bacterium]
MENYKQQIENMIDVCNLHATSYAGGKEINYRVQKAMRMIPRHNFVPHYPYEDRPVPIGHQQTISQPFIVAYMTDMLDISPLHTVLEIGTGSGYQAAVLSEVALKVYTVERIKALADQTKILLEHYSNVHMKIGNGYKGWKKNAPYDRIIVTAMPNYIPKLLIEQLKDGGKMIIPVKGNLILVTKTGKTYTTKSLIGVRFVPLVE